MPKVNRQPNGITHKERIFIKGLLQGKNATQAALAAYDTKNVKSAGNIASRTLDKANVQDAIKEALQANGLDLATLAGEAAKLAKHDVEKVSADVKLRAIIEMLKLHGAYPDRKTAHLNVNIKGKIKDMSFQEAKAKLQKMNQESNVFIEDADIL